MSPSILSDRCIMAHTLTSAHGRHIKWGCLICLPQAACGASPYSLCQSSTPTQILGCIPGELAFKPPPSTSLSLSTSSFTLVPQHTWKRAFQPYQCLLQPSPLLLPPQQPRSQPRLHKQQLPCNSRGRAATTATVTVSTF